MPYIGNTPAEKYAAFNVQYFTTSATDTYTLDRAVANELDIRLVINNVIQEPGAGKAYTAANTTLTLTSATAGTDTMYAVYIGKAVQTVNPGAGSVGTTALADNAVTEAKLNVSNSPTNGYVLSAQSGATGGLTWAADAAGTITAFTNGVDNRLVTATSATALNGEADLTFDGTNLDLADNKKLRLGTGNDFEIYHDGSNSIIHDGGTGDLLIRAEDDLRLQDTSGYDYIHCNTDSSVELYHNKVKKLETTANGIENTIAGNGTAGISFLTTTDHTANDKAYIGSHTSSGYGVNLVISRGGSDGFASETARFRNDGIVLINNNDTIFGGNILQVLGKNDAEVVAIQVATNGKKAIQFANASGVEAGSIVTSSSSTAFNTSSDYRLKENETPITDGITRLKTLKPYKFNFKTDPDKTVDGFFAHEVSNVIPEAITGTKDAMHPEVLYADKVLYTAEDDLPEGMNIGDIKTSADDLPEGKNFGDVKEATKINPQSIDQSKLVPLLVASVQELIAENETLKTRITTLENA